MEAERAPSAAWRFDRFTLDCARGALLGPDGGEVALRPKSLALLRLLVANPGRAVDREAIMSAVWPDVVVTDESITQCVRDIRKALGDEAQQVLKTVPKRGYLLAAEVAPVASTAPAPRVERRLAAILAADVVGYSRLMEKNEAGTFARLKELREELVEPILQRHSGRFVDLKGDGAIVEFQSVTAAVEAAVAVQRAMLDRDPELPEDRRIRYRIGINLGDVIVDGPTIYGDGINVAARIESLCEPGGVWLSRSVYNQVKGKLDLDFAPSGLHQVKNISEAVETFRVELDGVNPAPPSRSDHYRWHRPVLIVAWVVFALVFAGGVRRFWPIEPPPGKPAIAVLPFDNLGGDEATGRLADGVTEDIITDLARFRDLDVIARNSTEVYKGKASDIRQVGRDLDVKYILEGSIQQQAEQVRVTAQLIDAASGSHVWSERWDRPSRDVFAVQTELAEAVADKIGGYYSGTLVAAGQKAAKRKRPQDLTAYDLFLLGMEAKHRETREGMEEGVGLLKRSLAIDPNFARAWTGLFWAANGLSGYVDETPEARKTREDAARRAVELDPEDAEARVALATVYGDAGDLGHAEAEFDQALRLSPNSADLLAIYADWASSFGKPEAGVEAAARAMRLNPSTPQWAYSNFRHAYFQAGHYEDALRMQDRVAPEAYQRNDYVYRAATLAALGRTEEAHAAVVETLAHFPKVTVEWGAWWFGLSEADYRRLEHTMRKAGFPLCATDEDAKSTPDLRQLSECEAVRAKAANAAQAE